MAEDELTNLELSRAYNEAHRRLGELSFWQDRLQITIENRLDRIASGEGLPDDRNTCNQEIKRLLKHKEDSFNQIYLILKLEAEMALRTGDNS